MAVYYFLPELAGILLGVALITFLTKALEHPMGGLKNSVIVVSSIFIVGKIITTVFPDSPFAYIIFLVVEFFIIKSVFPGSYFKTFLFLILGTTYFAIFKLVLNEPISDILAGIIY